MDRILSTVLFLTVVGGASSVPMKSWAPRYYNGIELSPYAVVMTSPDNMYEERIYPSSKWVSVRTSRKKTQFSGSNAFMTLFQYIQGANEWNKKIAMTTPVLRMTPLYANAPANDETSFYLPENFQQNPPAPLDSNVYITEKTMRVYAWRFDGWSSEGKFQQELMKMEARLMRDGISYNRDVVFSAGYDGPTRFSDRRNEILVLKKEK